jgi:hypothetical protein
MPIDASIGLSSAAVQEPVRMSRILPDVAGLRVGRDVDQRGRQLEDLAEQALDQVGLARAGRTDAQKVRLARQLGPIDAVDVDSLDPLDVA